MKKLMMVAITLLVSGNAQANLTESDWINIGFSLIDKCTGYDREDIHHLKYIRTNTGGIYDSTYLDFSAFYEGSKHCGIFGCGSDKNVNYTLEVQATPTGKYKTYLYNVELNNDWCADDR